MSEWHKVLKVRPINGTAWYGIKMTLKQQDQTFLNLLFHDLCPKILENSDRNKMVKSNLTLCLAPTLFPSNNLGVSNAVMSGLIELGVGV